MAMRKVADAVVTIPWDSGDGKRYVTVGALLESDNNDASKGLPFVLMLDRHFNPAGISSHGGSIPISFYHPKDSNDRTQSPTKPIAATRGFSKPHPDTGLDSYDDDFPF